MTATETTSFVREMEVRYKGQPRKSPAKVTSSRDVTEFFRSLGLGDLVEERFYALFLDAKNKEVGWTMVSAGNISSCPVDPCTVFRAAILSGAVGVIFAHNHPSGDPSPSPDDVDLTERLCKAGKLIGVRVVDHVIVCHSDYTSFLDCGLIQHK
jgi:DNA repair protein RadC